MSKQTPWRFRGVQLDLARQMEPIETIERFIDFMAPNRLNVLVLYLEGRIRTPSFPYPSDAESYTPAQMKRIVAYAAKRGIETVPVVSTLGHCELFLRHPELAHLAELRHGRGRWGGNDKVGHVLCPSLPDTYAFLAAYLREVAEIFPSKYVHAGMDESWDVGCCDLCRPRAEGVEGQTGIFAKHVNDTHAIITRKLGKRIIMWDDMFEQYPEALRTIPRDIVMCCWQYDGDVTLPKAHFKNLERRDLLTEYGRLGFDYMVGSRELNADNILSLTRYAAKRRPLGGFVTTWEHSRDFLHAYYPNIAFAGRLWSNPAALDDPEALKRKVVADLFPNVKAQAAVDALRVFMDFNQNHASTRVESFLHKYSESRSTERHAVNTMLTTALDTYRAPSRKTSGLESDILEDILIHLDQNALQFDLRTLVREVFARAAARKPIAALWRQLQAAVLRIDKLAARRRSQWKKYRNGVLSTHNQLDRHWKTFHDNLAAFAGIVKAGKLDQTGILALGLFLPDAFSSPTVKVSIRYAGAKQWVPAAEGQYKPEMFGCGDCEYDHSSYYQVNIRIDSNRAPTAVLVEHWGYGGQGVRYLEVNNRAGRFVPESLTQTYGRVERPENVLLDNSAWCYLGEPDTGFVFHNPALGRVRHGLVITLRRES